MKLINIFCKCHLSAGIRISNYKTINDNKNNTMDSNNKNTETNKLLGKWEVIRCRSF